MSRRSVPSQDLKSQAIPATVSRACVHTCMATPYEDRLKELMEVREALQTSEQRHRAILETAVNAIITINERGIIDSINSSTVQMFGYMSEELIGKNISVLMPSPYREGHDGYLQNYKETGVRKIIGIGRETVAQRKDGSVFPIDLSIGEVVLPQGTFFTGIIRDITERKRLEQEILDISEKEQQRIGQDIHDDLCQQLAAIGCLAKVSLQRLQQTQSDVAPGLAEIVRLISSANTRAREMSRGLVPVVLEAGGLMSALGELASSTEKIFRISCRFWCEEQVMISHNLTATQLYRIAQEAVANALKHSGANRIEISLNLSDGRVILRVRDNGVGIAITPADSNSGMGLLTMTHRAKTLSGKLTIEQDEFGGTLVMCSVPLVEVSPKPHQRP